MIEYNKLIIIEFYVPDYRKLSQKPLHKVPVYYQMKTTLEATNYKLEVVYIHLN